MMKSFISMKTSPVSADESTRLNLAEPFIKMGMAMQ